MNDTFFKFEQKNWSGYTFIFPCVSVGNIGQLATDLLISTIPGIKKAGFLINASLVQPIVGYDPFDKNSTQLCTSLELYESEQLGLIIMQQRAPLLRGKRSIFARLLVDFIKAENFKETICLTSSYAYERLDSQLSGIQCRFLSTGDTQSNIDQLISELNWLHLEKRNDHNPNGDTQKNLEAYVPGGGVAQKFFKICKEENLNTKILIIFAHEGNNIPESFDLLNFLNQWKGYLTKMNRSNWQVPISWKYLFGPGIEANLQSRIF